MLNHTLNKALKTYHKQLLNKNFSKKLFIQDNGQQRNSMSGIRATIFGGTGFIGCYVGAALGYISSDLVYPSTHAFRMDDCVKELKLTANLGQSFIVREMNFKDPKMIERVISTSNVVINLIGPKQRYYDKTDFEWTNIEIPRRIAAACRKNPNIIRMVQFSAAGAEENSEALDWQTKWLGEQAVLNEFPNATILRPCTMYGPSDYFLNKFYRSIEMLYHGIPVYDDCTALRQPIHGFDVAQCVLNCLKLNDTVGKTYELGGPHVFTRLELYEIMFNILKRKPSLIHVNRDFALFMADHIRNNAWWSKQEIVKDALDCVVNPNARTIEELYVNPVGFAHGAEEYLYREAEVQAEHPEHDER